MGAASTSAFFTNPATSIAVMIAAALVVLGFTAITIQYIVAIVESYLVVSAGVIFLGFGGSRWTTPYVERYIGLGVSTGVKIMILYMLIAAGLNLSNGWLSEANGIGTSPNPSMTAFDVMGAGLIFMALCWQVPKLFAAVLGGSPALSGGDLVSTGTAVVGGAAMVASVGASAIAAVAGATAAASCASGGTAIGGGAASRSMLGIGGTTATGSVLPPSSLSAGPSGNGRLKPPSTSVSGAAAVPPPTPNGGSFESARSVLSSLGGEILAGSGFETQRPAAGFRSYSVPVASRPQSASPANSPGAGDESTAATESAGGGSQAISGPTPDITSSGSVGKPQTRTPRRRDVLASGAQRAERVFSGAAQRLRNAGPRFRGLPSDAAPHTQPPRMPIDHSE
jgi:type IV secretion system protein TrbL